MKLICKIFGHKVNSVQELMARIKLAANNTQQIKLDCERCGETLIEK